MAVKRGRPKTVKGFSIDRAQKVSKKIKIEDMDDAIVDGKILFKKGDILMLRRDHDPNKSNVVSSCSVMNVNDDGSISLYDNTLQQWFLFNSDQYKQITLKLYATS